MVVFGETDIIAFVCPPPQTKVEPPVAVNITSSPAQIVPSSSMRPDRSVTVIEAFGAALIMIVPTALIVPQPPVNGILYVKIPLTVGVPLMVIRFADHDADTPVGRPIAVPIPVAPIVLWVIFVSAELIQSVGVEDAKVTVLAGVTTIEPVALKLSQPPIKGIL